jgi:hypothetical protein
MQLMFAAFDKHDAAITIEEFVQPCNFCMRNSFSSFDDGCCSGLTVHNIGHVLKSITTFVVRMFSVLSIRQDGRYDADVGLT